MKDEVRDGVMRCFEAVLTDEAWQNFGFPKRPTYGFLIQKLRPRWKVARLPNLTLQLNGPELALLAPAAEGARPVHERSDGPIAELGLVASRPKCTRVASGGGAGSTRSDWSSWGFRMHRFVLAQRASRGTDGMVDLAARAGSG